MPRHHTTFRRRYRELAFRESDGVAVHLYWDSHANEVFVRVRDLRDGDDFVLNPPKHQALPAFHHPYALRPFNAAKAIVPDGRTAAGGVT
jgi:hypothetical protein